MCVVQRMNNAADCMGESLVRLSLRMKGGGRFNPSVLKLPPPPTLPQIPAGIISAKPHGYGSYLKHSSTLPPLVNAALISTQHTTQ